MNFKKQNNHLTSSPAKTNEFTGGVGLSSNGAYAELEMGMGGGHFMSFSRPEIQDMLKGSAKDYFNIESLKLAIKKIDEVNETGIGYAMKRPNSKAILTRQDLVTSQTSGMAEGPEKALLVEKLSRPFNYDNHIAEVEKIRVLAQNSLRDVLSKRGQMTESDSVDNHTQQIPQIPQNKPFMGLPSLSTYLPDTQVNQTASKSIRPN